MASGEEKDQMDDREPRASTTLATIRLPGDKLNELQSEYDSMSPKIEKLISALTSKDSTSSSKHDSKSDQQLGHSSNEPHASGSTECSEGGIPVPKHNRVEDHDDDDDDDDDDIIDDDDDDDDIIDDDDDDNNDGAKSSTPQKGGYCVDYDGVCCGSPGYCFYLILLKNEETFQQHVDKLKGHATKILENIECKSQRNVKEFTIGKTLAQQIGGTPKKGEMNEQTAFDPTDSGTWKLGEKGVQTRWDDYAQRNYNGLVTMAAITEDQIPQEVKDGPLHQFQGCNLVEKYALFLENQLTVHFALHVNDSRLGNTTLKPGKISKKPKHAGLVYVAFKLEP